MKLWKRLWMNIVLCLVILLGWSTPSEAQVNIEKKLVENKEEDGFSGDLGFDLQIRSGNVDIQEINLLNQINHSGKIWDTFILLEYGVGWAGGDHFSNEGLLHFRQMYRAHQRFWPELFLQMDYNRKRRVDFRGLAGSGFRLQLIQHERIMLWWGSSYMLEHEELNLRIGDSHPKKETVHRWSNYISVKTQFSKRVQGTWTAYGQPRMRHFVDVRMLTEARVEVELSSHLILGVLFRLRYDSKPPLDVEAMDYLLKNRLSFSF